MAWKPNVPQPTDTLSQSQADILGNFQALDALFDDGVQDVVILPKQTSDKTTLVDQIALYSKVGTSTNLELFMRRQSNGAVIDCTGSGVGTNGWSYLPSGLLIKWGQAAMPSGGSHAVSGQTVTYPTGGTIPVFNNVFQVILSQAYTLSQTTAASNGFALNASTTANFKVTWSGNNASGAIVTYLAIGN